MSALRSLARPRLALLVALFASACDSNPASTNADAASIFEVRASASAGGTITPATQHVGAGATATLTVTPDVGQRIVAVLGCGGTLAGSTYTTEAISGDCDVVATFVDDGDLPEFTVSGSPSSEGTIAPASLEVVEGETATLTLTPNAGFYVTGVSGCGGRFYGTTYETAPITAPCTVSATYAPLPRIWAGGFHTCARRTDGSVACWGQNASGQLGVASFSLTAHGDESGEQPGAHPAITMPSSSVALWQMGLGTQHSCAILSSGDLYCFGENQNGQLGLGTNADRKVMTLPTSLMGQGVAEIAAGGQFSCARLVNGEVWCFGLNSSGELGNGNADTRFSPYAPINFGSDMITSVSAGAASACALTSLGAVRCWGDNSSGQLGDSDGGNDSATPSGVNLQGETAIALDVGGLFACAIVQSGGDVGVRCWGENGSGQLGNNDGTNTDLDVASMRLSFDGEVPARLALGGEHACMLSTAGNVFCWGESDAGQTGQNDTTDDLVPMRVDLGPYTVSEIAAGRDHTCVVLVPNDTSNTSRPIRCWGEGGVGSLGLGSTSDLGDNESVANDVFNVVLE